LSRRTRLAAAATGALSLSAALIPAAQADTVTSGKLDWTQTNVYISGAGNPRTWLGYATGLWPTNANGSAAPVAPATGPVVDTNSTRGTAANDPSAGGAANYTWSFPADAAAGSYDPYTGIGTVNLDGGLSYTAPQPPAGHGIDVSVTNPRIVLNGLRGQLIASGNGSSAALGGPAVPYDSSAVYDLDLSNASVTLKADGSRVIGPIVPSLAGQQVFGSSYAVGAGPDRSPNTFGSFSLTLSTKPDEVRGPAGAAGATGATGATGAQGVAGRNGTNGTTTTIRSVVAILAKAPYKGSSTRRVTVYNSKATKIASGTIKGRTLKVTLASAVKVLPSTVKVKASGASKSTTVKIPS
jgi:hypothetical protein